MTARVRNKALNRLIREANEFVSRTLGMGKGKFFSQSGHGFGSRQIAYDRLISMLYIVASTGSDVGVFHNEISKKYGGMVEKWVNDHAGLIGEVAFNRLDKKT